MSIVSRLMVGVIDGTLKVLDYFSKYRKSPIVRGVKGLISILVGVYLLNLTAVPVWGYVKTTFFVIVASLGFWIGICLLASGLMAFTKILFSTNSNR